MKGVYVTALSNGNYIPGVKGLIHSLNLTETAHDIVIMIPESKENELIEGLKNWGILSYKSVKIKKVPDIALPEEIASQKDHYWTNTFIKLQAFSLYEYAKVVLIDSDMIVCDNIDELFERPSFSAVIAGKCAEPEWDSLNSGIVVIEPNAAFYKQLISLISPTITDRNEQGLNTGDQDVIHAAVPDWSQTKKLILDERYNVFFGQINTYCKAYKTNPYYIKVIHFVGAIKPWTKKRGVWIKIFIRELIKRDFKHMVFSAMIWRKYHIFCEK
ncbi:MAG: hypothetical protein IKH30_18115 [Clostridia bacterium]|nr:hypothetical protein [Clostridia bacterium]